MKRSPHTRALGGLFVGLLLAAPFGCGSDGSRPAASPGEPPAPSPAPVATPSPAPRPDPPGDVPAVDPGPIAMRRLTQEQYRATIADVLGDDIVPAGRLEPDTRQSGLIAVGTSEASLTPSGLEGYDTIARAVAEQAVDATHRDRNVPCQPEALTGTDDACTGRFVRAVGRKLFRRPLRDEEVATRVEIARNAASDLADFYAGLEVALSTLLLSPEFLFRVEVDEADPSNASARRLTSLSMASRLSYFLWNTTPDDELLDAAEAGELVLDRGLADQVDRMLASPRLEKSVRSLFSDMYGLEQLEQGLVRKDPSIFPVFSQALMRDAREQTLRVAVEHLLTDDGAYPSLFTTRHSFMTRPLGLVYRVPVAAPDGWEPFTFPDDSRRAGVLTHVSLLALHSHPGRSSPTLRGKFIREVILCQDVPPPPGDIDFSMFADDAATSSSTARQRLEAHVANPACAGCHAIMDPIGLALETMDGIGIERDTENGERIDASGELGGVAFDDAPGLGAVIAGDPALTRCFVQTLYEYATGRVSVAGERELLDYLTQSFGASGHRLRDLLRLIVLSDGFRTTSGPRAAGGEP